MIYRSDDLSLKLSPDELRRLVANTLHDKEYFALRDQYGMAFEWHEDFYDAETGEPLQPKE